MTDKGQEYLKTFKQLQTQRAPLEDTWRECFEHSYPLRGAGFGEINDATSNASRAKNDQAILYDSTATEACRALASLLIGGLTPDTANWFDLAIPGTADHKLSGPVKEFLQQGAKTLLAMIQDSNYSAQALDFFLDIAIVGQAGLYIELLENGKLNFERWPLSSLYIADGTKAQKIDTVYRRVMMTVAQAASKFGPDALPDDMKEVLAADPTAIKTYAFIHVIQPRVRAGKRANGKTAKQLPFESVYIAEKCGTITQESGYHEFPVVIPRWNVLPGTEYGVGPLNEALPDIKTLNKMMEMFLSNASMAIAGTYIGVDDNTFDTEKFKFEPGVVNWVGDVNNIKALASGGNIGVTNDIMMKLESKIKQIMMADGIAPPQQTRQMTAEEIKTRNQIARSNLSPAHGRLRAEFLNPLIERCYGLAARAGALGEAPEDMPAFMPVFKSPLAQAARMDEVMTLDRFEANLMQKSQVEGIGPSILDNYDPDAAMRYRASLEGMPVGLIRDSEAVAAIREKRAREQQAAMQAEQEAQMAQQQADAPVDELE